MRQGSRKAEPMIVVSAPPRMEGPARLVSPEREKRSWQGKIKVAGGCASGQEDEEKMTEGVSGLSSSQRRMVETDLTTLKQQVIGLGPLVSQL